MERALTIAAVRRVVVDGERAEHVVSQTLRANRALDNDARARVARRIYGVCVLRARLRFLAANSSSCVNDGDDDAASLLDAYVHFEENGSLLPSTLLWPADRRERIAVERSAPQPFVDALSASLGDDGADKFLAASNIPGPRTLRANALKCSRIQVLERLRSEGIVAVPGALAPHAVHVEGPANLFGCAAWRDGWFEVQDEASQLAAAACGVSAGDVVVDLCAGRGGKTLALAAMMNNSGVVYVNDVDSAAMRDLTPRLKRAGVTCVRSLVDVAEVDENGVADVVLVDAPCSSTGALRRSPDLRWQPLVTPVDVQGALLQRAGTLVKPGGRVVYATCSVLVEENDDVIKRVVASDAALSLVSATTYLPHVHGTDGFFVAVLTRRL